MTTITYGGVYQRASDQRWVAVYYLTNDLGDRKRRPAYGATEQEAIAKRDTIRDHLTGARRAWQDSDLLCDVIEYVLYEHLPSRPRAKRLAPTTIDGYVSLYRRHLRERLIGVRLRDVDGVTFDAIEDALDQAGLDPHTIGIAFTIMRKALSFACRRGVLRHNVGKEVEQPVKKEPSGKRRVAKAPDVEQARRVIEALQTGHEAHDACLVMMASGMRIGEALAMRDFELDLARATHDEGEALDWVVAHDVQWLRKVPGEARQRWTLGDTKNHSPRDTIVADFALPALDRCVERKAIRSMTRMRCGVPTCRRILRPAFRGALHVWEHVTPPEDAHEPLVAKGKAYEREIEEHGLLFATRYGTPLREKTITTHLAKACEQARIAPVLTPHSLRYAFATIMRVAGVELDLIQKMMGHKTSKITELLYVQPLREQRQAAARAYNERLTS